MNPILLRTLRWSGLGLVGLVLLGSFGLACTYVYLSPSLPTAQNMHKVQMAVPLRVYSRSGGLILQFGEERRIPVQFEDIPLIVRQAVLAAEDDRFFEHQGVDWMGLSRALFKVTVSGSAVQGGSTITQQTARQLFLTLDKTLRRKLAELFLTWRMERDFTKEQILSLYLNKIYFGQRSYGVAAAAEVFYGRKLADLTVAQAATLAGIVQLPSRYNPVTNPRAAENRRSYVLGRMVKLGYIDEATAAEAAKEPVASHGHALLTDVEAPYVAELVRQEVVARFGESAINEGYRVYTTIDDRLQPAANRAVRIGLMDYDRPRGYRGPLGQAELPAAATPDQLDALLQEYTSVNVLEPAVVLSVAETSAEVHVRRQGTARIAWDGMSWARRSGRNGLGPAPRKAAEVLKRGDVIHVVSDGRGHAQLAQVPEAQAALIALDPRDGAIVAMAGGFDFYSNAWNHTTQALRQPGSGFKPFLYSAALDSGITPSSLYFDGPVMVESSDEENWRPGNSGGDFLGFIRLREALVRSRNTVSIRVLQDIGVTRLVEHAARFGFNPETMPRNLTLALGSQTTTPLQMARGFAVFANGGFRVDPYFIGRIEDAEGNVVYEASPLLACAECEAVTAPEAAPLTEATISPAEVDGEAVAYAVDDMPSAVAAEDTPATFAVTDTTSASRANLLAAAAGTSDSLLGTAPVLRGMENIPEAMRALAGIQGGAGYLDGKQLAPRVISPQNAWLMSDILHDVTVRGTAQRTRALGRDDLAGKTGTTNEGRDNWFNGFTTNLVASVWVGFDDNRPLGTGAEGSTTAVPIWMHFMKEALQGVPSARPPRPAGLIDLKVSPYTGRLASAFNPEAITETFMVEHLPDPPAPGEETFGPGTTPGSTRSEPIF